ncbi:MAG: hypothetical protein JRE45_20830 [Deltaproteobacteria bacterium]|nr:hypothetical protein [Deltaproteobacteria bacterium]
MIDERDVAANHPQGSSCRLYDQGDGTLDPSPPVTVGRYPIDAETQTAARYRKAAPWPSA